MLCIVLMIFCILLVDGLKVFVIDLCLLNIELIVEFFLILVFFRIKIVYVKLSFFFWLVVFCFLVRVLVWLKLNVFEWLGVLLFFNDLVKFKWYSIWVIIIFCGDCFNWWVSFKNFIWMFWSFFLVLLFFVVLLLVFLLVVFVIWVDRVLLGCWVFLLGEFDVVVVIGFLIVGCWGKEGKEGFVVFMDGLVLFFEILFEKRLM